MEAQMGEDKGKAIWASQVISSYSQQAMFSGNRGTAEQALNLELGRIPWFQKWVESMKVFFFNLSACPKAHVLGS